jgi:hypothetical protein
MRLLELFWWCFGRKTKSLYTSDYTVFQSTSDLLEKYPTNHNYIIR